MYRIVIVDDEQIVLNGLELLISKEKLDCEVVATADNGIDGVEVIKKHKPDIIITDIRMPGKSGFELIKECQEFLPRAYYAIISGYTEFEYARQALMLRVVHYIDKPVTIDKIRNLLKLIDERNKIYGFDSDETDTADGKQPAADVISVEQVHRTVKDVLEYIENHYSENFGLNEMAEMVEMNPAYLSSLFKNEVGVSFVKYLTQFRIDKAKKFLDEGYQVGEVSEMVGYGNYRYFTDIFKKHEGKTPTEYKGNVRKHD